uniref:nucleoside-diphosphate kinase n=1 Tax=Suricata suricatta TaxID=37032 RepID=A0A673UP51_SURSU
MATCEHTFIAVKPDGVQHSLMGEIIRCFEQKVSYLIAMKLIQDLLKEHYIDLKGRPPLRTPSLGPSWGRLHPSWQEHYPRQ